MAGLLLFSPLFDKLTNHFGKCYATLFFCDGGDVREAPPTARTLASAESYVTDFNVTRFLCAPGSYPEKSEPALMSIRERVPSAVNENR